MVVILIFEISDVVCVRVSLLCCWFGEPLKMSFWSLLSASKQPRTDRIKLTKGVGFHRRIWMLRSRP